MKHNWSIMFESEEARDLMALAELHGERTTSALLKRAIREWAANPSNRYVVKTGVAACI